MFFFKRRGEISYSDNEYKKNFQKSLKSLEIIFKGEQISFERKGKKIS